MREPQSYYIGLLEMLQGKAGILLCIFCNTVFSQIMPVMEFLKETVHCFQHNAQLQAYFLYIIYEK